MKTQSVLKKIIGRTIIATSMIASMAIAATEEEASLVRGIFKSESGAKFASNGQAVKASNSTQVAKSGDQKQAVQQFAGLQTFVELKQANGKFAPVDSTHPFKTGDEFRLKITSSESGFITVANKDQNGELQELISRRSAKSQEVVPYKSVYVPAQGSFQFDNKPGRQTLYISVSRQLEDDATLIKSAFMQNEGNSEITHTASLVRGIVIRPSKTDVAEYQAIAKSDFDRGGKLDRFIHLNQNK